MDFCSFPPTIITATSPWPHLCLRKETILLGSISQLRSSTQQPPLPNQDQHYAVKATISRIPNESTLTYRCCTVCWTALHENKSYPNGCPKITCTNKQGHSTHCLSEFPFTPPPCRPRYRSNIEIFDKTGRITLTLFEQLSEELFNTSSS